MVFKNQSLINLEIVSSEVDGVVKNIEMSHINGGIIIKIFDIINKKVINETINPYFYNNSQDGFKKLLLSTDIKSSIPLLKLDDGLQGDTDFQLSNSFAFESEIASAIYQGGAYFKFKGNSRESKNIAANFTDFIFGIEDPDSNIKTFESCKPWSKWFFDVAWDVSWLIFDGRKNKLWIICITDTD
ncbi:hypothetical protein [Marininema halotolerans]|uniref:Uncharacterized protein n=1 Tax=Marininema halotolerans TaxID=1155944 RepID=A0A1I6UN26_9BACL|nr:hypothetical protein [Marininema halotolerans]SFT02862.1 hypothetical protein SAMN05444972_11843 [Marininema halotolerans]